MYFLQHDKHIAMKPIVTKQGTILQLFITVLIFFSCTTVASAQKAEQGRIYRHRFLL